MAGAIWSSRTGIIRTTGSTTRWASQLGLSWYSMGGNRCNNKILHGRDTTTMVTGWTSWLEIFWYTGIGMLLSTGYLNKSNRLGTMMNSPCTPCPSDTSTHMYSPLYFATHVHNIHCNTPSQANMKVDGLFVHPKTAHIVHKKMDKLSVHPLFVTYCPKRIFHPLFLWHYVQAIKASPETCITSSVWHFDPIYLVHFGQSTAAQTVPWFLGLLIQVSFRPLKKRKKKKGRNILPQNPLPIFISVW